MLGCQGEDLGIPPPVGLRQSRAPDGAGAQVIVVGGLAIEARFELAQAAHAGQVAINHGHQLIPTAEALAVLVSTLLGNQSIEDAARQRF
ncbi:hypothetical protein D3C78_1439190 [compost metagenome]